MSSPNHQPRLDLIRILAILGVVGIHLMYPVFSRPDFLGGISWWFATCLHTISLTSVPLLIMISGQLLLPKTESIAQNTRRTFNRLILPLLIWIPLYVYWSNHYTQYKYSFLQIVGLLLTGNLFHLYFLIILIGLYVTLPLLRVLVTSSTEITHYLLSLTWIVAIGSNLSNYASLNSNSYHLFTWWLPYLGYFLSGHLLASQKLSSKDQKLLLFGTLLWFTTTLVLSYLGVDLVGHNTNLLWRNGTFYFNSFLSPNIVLLSLACYLLLLHAQLPIQLNFSWFNRPLQALAKATYGVYLIHPIIIRFIDIRLGFAIEFVNSSLWPFILTRSFLVIALSFLLSHLLRQLPYVKKVVGE